MSARKDRIEAPASPARDHAPDVATGMGWFSLLLGAAEIAAGPAIARGLGLPEKTGALIRAYGAREIGAGLGVLSAPREPFWMWARFVGDLMDGATLAPALKEDNPKRTWALAAAGFVAGAAVIDALTALQQGGERRRPERKASRKALLLRFHTKPGKSDGFAAFLAGAVADIARERGTKTWHALRLGRDEFAVFDTFPNEAAAARHMAGRVARGVARRTLTHLEGPPRIEHAEVLAYKLPDEQRRLAA